MNTRSLRLRLTLIILVPLLVLGGLIGTWQIEQSRRTAKDIFDRSLLTTALAIVGDVARSGGDALSLETRDLLSNTSGGPVFYHVYAPDGVYVTGYASPPVARSEASTIEGVQFFDSIYNRRPVRGLRLTDVATLDGISGTYTYTVWQDLSVREAFLSKLIWGTVIVIGLILGTLALVVWFGVVIGLRPLIDLEEAVSRRGLDDLSPIRRKVPAEVQGLVRRLNALFAQVVQAMEAQRTLISNAAHQLRNPIAGILALAEAVRSAPDLSVARDRADELILSAQHARDLANRLLTLERVQSDSAALERAPVDLPRLIDTALRDFRAEAEERGIAIAIDLAPVPQDILVDRMLLREALANLIDNALVHGGSRLSRIEIAGWTDAAQLHLQVRDDGRGIPEAQHDIVLSRFGQAEPGVGSGLGLSIASAVTERHGGTFTLEDAAPGLSVRIDLPLVA